MEAGLKRTPPFIILNGNLPVLFHTGFPGFVSRLAAPLLATVLLIPSATSRQQAPDPLDQHYSAAQTFQLGGDFDRAETEYHQVLALALQHMGNLLMAEKNDFQEAVHLFEEAVAARPTYEDARTDLAMVYFRAGHLDRAGEQAAQVIKDDPRNARALQ